MSNSPSVNGTRTCVWVLADMTPCGEPTRYVMQYDNGEVGAPKVRAYYSFCDTHAVEVAKLEESMEDDLS